MQRSITHATQFGPATSGSSSSAAATPPSILVKCVLCISVHHPHLPPSHDPVHGPCLLTLCHPPAPPRQHTSSYFQLPITSPSTFLIAGLLRMILPLSPKSNGDVTDRNAGAVLYGKFDNSPLRYWKTPGTLQCEGCQKLPRKFILRCFPAAKICNPSRITEVIAVQL